MHPLFGTLLAVALVAGTSAQAIVEELSFGHNKGISPNSFAIPGWSMLGQGHVPQLLSDKVILTPPYGGNKKGAVWSDKTNSLRDWQAEFEFRAGPTDRGSGSLQLWYVNDGARAVSASSIYTVNKFDGLALVVDTNAGVQKIRGFLNDGSVDYKAHSNIDGLAFGHCDYNYRNVGKPSRLQIKSTSGGLQVRIDDRDCFTTNKVFLPSGYNFGMTAASGDPPDSFEVFKFILTPQTSPVTPQHQQQQQQPGQVVPNAIPQMDDNPASHYTTSTSQFEDLHNRLNLLSKSITNLFAEITKHTQAEETRYQEILNRMPNGQMITSLDSRVANLDRMISNLERELKASDHNAQFNKLSEQLQRTHEGVTEHVPQRLREYVQAHTPRIGFILYSFMAFQSVCIGVFVWFKWRKSTMPKKYL